MSAKSVVLAGTTAVIERARRICAITVALAALQCAGTPPAGAGEFTSGVAPAAQNSGTEVVIRGIVGESFSITYVDASGTTRTKNVTVGPLGIGSTVVPAAKGTAITVNNLTQPMAAPGNHTASRFTPGSETVVTTLAMDPASTLTAFGQTFVLGGSFTTIATAAEYDPLSPAYGNLSGVIPGDLFDVIGTGSAGTIDIELAGDPPWLINVASVWDAAEFPATGLAVPFSQTLSGTLTFGALSTPFTGLVSGTLTFLSDNFERFVGTIDLPGIGQGAFIASGQSRLVAEPGTLPLSVATLMMLAAAVMLARRRGRPRSRAA